MQPRSPKRCANASRKQVETMQILAEGLTDIGQHRQSNEDSLFIDQDQSLYIVADGVGGQPAGEIASHLVAERLPSILIDLTEKAAFASRDLLDKAVHEVNRALLETASGKPEWQGMSTTVVAAWCRADEILIANVGDSRAYLIREQTIEQLSEDHTVLAEQQRLGVAEEEQTPGMAHVLTRCLGLEPEIEVCVGSVPMQPGDRILLCSDGLTDSLSEEVIRSVILSTTSPGEACRMLVELANRNGGRDNITVLLIYLDEATLKNRISNLFGRRT